ncbi:hypothetical protein B0H12DRAFT_123077 [Mycena haematopus]|nr:hypothetical protein B0H12DRAFT_123077 [Mycena haematopus]
MSGIYSQTSDGSCGSPLSPSAANFEYSQGTENFFKAAAAPDFSVVEEFLDASVFRPVAAKGHVKGVSTRAPGEWDQHLSSELILKQVKYLPSLQDSLGVLPRNALRTHPYPPPNSDDQKFPFPDRRAEMRTRALDDPIRSENDLVGYYSKTTASWCMTVASALEFELDCWDRGLMEWTLSPASKYPKAIADGHLRCTQTLTSEILRLPGVEELWSSSDLTGLRDCFPDLSVWEFKSLKVAESMKPNALLAVTQLDSFPWEGCKKGVDCILVHTNPMDDGPHVTGAMMGPDVELSTLFNIDLAATQCWESPNKEPIGVKALHIIQQAWAEAVRVDATFICIQMGIYEFIAIRQRKTQTMYLSDVIRPSVDFGYLGMETGLYMAIFREAKHRLNLLDKTSSFWTNVYSGEHASDEEDSGSTNRTMDGPDIFARNILVNQVVPKGTNTIPFLVGQPYYRQTVLDGAVVSGAGSPENSKVPQNIIRVRVYPSKDYLNQGRSRTSCRADLTVDAQLYTESIKDNHAVGRTFMKNSADTSSTEALKREASIYQALHPAQVKGIPKYYGFFLCPSERLDLPPYPALLLSFAGWHWDDQRLLTDPHKDQFRRTLRAIHKAGYLHGNLKATKLLLKEEDSFIVGLAKAHKKPSGSKGRQECAKEMRQLELLLGGNPEDAEIPPIPDLRDKRVSPVSLGPTLNLDGVDFTKIFSSKAEVFGSRTHSCEFAALAMKY